MADKKFFRFSKEKGALVEVPEVVTLAQDMQVNADRLTLKEFRALTADMPENTVILVDDGESACDVKTVHTHWHGAVSFTFGQ